MKFPTGGPTSRPRLFIPEQVITRQGTDLQDAHGVAEVQSRMPWAKWHLFVSPSTKKSCVEGGCLHNLSDQVWIFSIESRAWCPQRTRCDTRSWYPRKLDMIWMSHSACLWCARWMLRDLGVQWRNAELLGNPSRWRGCLHPAAGQLWSTHLWMLALCYFVGASIVNVLQGWRDAALQ